MPNWKKVITSGSNAELSSLFVAGAITASGAISASGDLTANNINAVTSLTAAGLTYPTTDGDDGNILMTDGAGGLTLQPNTSFFNVKNVDSGTLLKGTPVHATGTTGNTSEVIAASASSAPTMPATYVLAEDLDADEEGRAILTGYLNGINTSNGFTPGDVLYVGETGGYTPFKPSGSNLIQNIGIIIKSDVSNGSVLIYGSGRSNDIPNITSGYAWVGNSDQIATAVATSSFVVDNANTASYVAAANIDGTIDISDQTNLAGGTNLTLSDDTMNLDANISLTTVTASSDITTAGSLITTKTGSVTDPALLIGVNSGYLAGNNTGIILEDLVPGTNFFVPYFVSNGAKIFGFGTVMSMEKDIDMQTNKLYFDQDSTNTYIASNTDDPEDLEIHADQDIILNPDGQVIANSNISASGAITGSDVYINDWGSVSASLATIPTNNNQLTNGAGYTTNTGTVDTSGTPVDNDFAKFTDANTIEGRSYSEVKTDLSLNNVENTALSTYTGNGGALDNQYITNGAGYTTNTGTVDTSGTPANNQLAIFTDSDTIEGDSDLTWDGSTFTITGYNRIPNTDGSDQYYGDVVAFGGGGTLTQGSIYYLDSSQNWQLADASAASTAEGMLGIATDTSIRLLVKGIARHAGWSGLGHGSVLYLSETAGELTTTKPTTSGAIVRVIGYCTNTTTREIYFNPSADWIELA
jgi:hypothetical protein